MHHPMENLHPSLQMIIFNFELSPYTMEGNFYSYMLWHLLKAHVIKWSYFINLAKVRRLYDIANILSSLELIQKVHIRGAIGKKPGFKWIGVDIDSLVENASKWRRFLISVSKLSWLFKNRIMYIFIIATTQKLSNILIRQFIKGIWLENWRCYCLV
jgi:hypothetical protein